MHRMTKLVKKHLFSHVAIIETLNMSSHKNKNIQRKGFSENKVLTGDGLKESTGYLFAARE